MRGARTLFVIFIAGSCPAVRADERTFEAVRQAIIDQVAGHRSIQYKMHFESEMTAGETVAKTVGDTLFAGAKRDDARMFRMEIQSSTTRTTGDKSEVIASSILALNDGKHGYVVQEAQGQKSAVKHKADARPARNPTDYKLNFDTLVAENDIKLKADETVDGIEAYVVESAPKKPDASPYSRAVTYFRRDTGLMLKSVSYDKQDQPVMTMTFSDYRLDEDISPDRFVFTLPDGVELVDMTR